jgi:outer membrane protein OmpA-like peptidoglycan-associated protein
MRNIIIICFSIYNITVLCNSACAQVQPFTKLNKTQQNTYTQIIALAKENKYALAKNQMQNLLKQVPNFQDGWLSLGGIFSQEKKYDSATIAFVKAFAIDSTNAREYYLPYSIALAGTGDFTKALSIVNKFLATPNLSDRSIKGGNYRKSCYENALSFAMYNKRQGYNFSPKNLGASVNTAWLEYYPAINVNNNYLIFTRRIPMQQNAALQEDFFQAFKNNGIWQSASPLQGGINTEDNEAAQTISADGNYLVFTICNSPDGLGSCDLYYAQFNGKTWSSPINMGRNVNTEFWESAPSLSPDGKDLYFTSNRAEETIGGKDIFVSHRLPNGNWSKAENLGTTINTKADEASPFIHFDNESLYFLSNGHSGIGGDDLFMAKKSMQQTFSTPINLGYPINTIENEGSLVITTDGSTAYFASDRAGGYGGLDIYSFDVPKDIAPLQTTWLKGQVLDSVTNKGVPAMVYLTDRKNGHKRMQVQTNEDGAFMVTLPVAMDYVLYVNRKNYFFYTENFTAIKEYADALLQKKILLKPLQLNNSFIVPNIYFPTKQFHITEESYGALDQLVELLNINTTLQIQIEGHTDNVGTVKDNIKLSQNRANTIKNYLLIKGIAESRLITRGFGSSKPLDKNNNEIARAKNRRTEIKIIKL